MVVFRTAFVPVRHKIISVSIYGEAGGGGGGEEGEGRRGELFSS